ncbi:MAG: hypothetical protein LBB67_01950 [Oscillospiraceae bacterium]|nr:hypothetical protein [Oscillospiraceae bacterium]
MDIVNLPMDCRGTRCAGDFLADESEETVIRSPQEKRKEAVSNYLVKDLTGETKLRVTHRKVKI